MLPFEVGIIILWYLTEKSDSENEFDLNKFSSH